MKQDNGHCNRHWHNIPGYVYLAVLLLLSPFNQNSAAAFDKIPVAVTILPQAYFVERIGGNYTEIKTMIPKGMNPETYEPTPQQLIGLSQARIYVKIGGDTFPAEKRFLKLLGNKVARVEVISMAEGTGRQNQDPHIWLSPSAVKNLSRKIGNALVRLDPAHRHYYEDNLSLFLRNIEKTDSEIRSILTGMEGKTFMIYHPAWGHFAAEYGLIQLAIEEEGKPVNMSHMKEMIDIARKKGINVIFVQRGFDLRNARAVAREIGAAIVETDPLEKNWLNNLKSFAAKLKEAGR